MNMDLDVFQRQVRWDRLLEPIRNISQNNAMVHDVLQQYVTGRIMTVEEALCQCIAALSINYEHLINDYLRYKTLITHANYNP